MLVDKVRNRILLEDGTSVVSIDTMTRSILKQKSLGERVRVISCPDSKSYETIYGELISIPEDYNPILPTPDHSHSDEDLDRILDLVERSKRFDGTSEMLSRIEKELDFFTRTSNIRFLLSVVDLINKMKENNVVWGVGRGSCCASLVLYLLEVHDVNPLVYGINFSEMSKDLDDDE